MHGAPPIVHFKPWRSLYIYVVWLRNVWREPPIITFLTTVKPLPKWQRNALRAPPNSHFEQRPNIPASVRYKNIKILRTLRPKGSLYRAEKELSRTNPQYKLSFSHIIIRRLQKEVAISSRSLSRGLFNVYWLIESKCLGEFSWISLLYRLGVRFTKRLLVRK